MHGNSIGEAHLVAVDKPVKQARSVMARTSPMPQPQLTEAMSQCSGKRWRL